MINTHDKETNVGYGFSLIERPIVLSSAVDGYDYVWSSATSARLPVWGSGDRWRLSRERVNYPPRSLLL